jgi:S-adenosylmethionine:tRNA ribosyltransferase-isomerase
MFVDVPDLLHPGDLLVFNDTRVTAKRLLGHKSTGGRAELLLLHSRLPGQFEALAKPGKRLQPGTRIEFEDGLFCVVDANLDDGLKLVNFGDGENWIAKLDTQGSVPLPPYIHAQLNDPERYQTVYAKTPGSAAAPTAGLHFTPEIIAELTAKGVGIAHVTLDVGLDTFRPVMSEDLSQHQMHGETCEVPPETVGAVSKATGRIVAVGTTAVRTLETMATGRRELRAGRTSTEIFIRPGFEFKIVDGMFTNFHLPKTTMLMMISALAGHDKVFSAYVEAVREQYRFLSFGDSMLIF